MSSKMVNNADWLSGKLRFTGRAFIAGKWYEAFVILKPNLEVTVYMPYVSSVLDKIPRELVGLHNRWEIKIYQFYKRVITSQYETFADLIKKFTYKSEIKTLSCDKTYTNKPWVKIELYPETYDFTNTVINSNAPDEWGISFYPEQNNRTLYHVVHESPEFGTPDVPSPFVFDDNCLYFKNKLHWSIKKMQGRKELLTDLLILFAGEPLSAKLLIGRHNRNIVYVHIDLSFLSNGHKCLGSYTGHAAIRDKTFKPLSSIFMKRVDEILSSQKKQRRYRTILSYYKSLYSQYYREIKVAFCYQLLEGLAKLKGLSLDNSRKKNTLKELLKKNGKNLCSACIGIINNEISKKVIAKNSAFDKDIEQATNKTINVSVAGKHPVFQAKSLIDLARHYRNEVFHGGYFRNIEKVKNIMMAIPPDYRRDIPVVLQAMVSILGVHIIVGIDFDKLTARKRLL